MFNKNLNEIIDAETPFAKDEINKRTIWTLWRGKENLSPTKRIPKKKTKNYERPNSRIQTITTNNFINISYF